MFIFIVRKSLFMSKHRNKKPNLTNELWTLEQNGVAGY